MDSHRFESSMPQAEHDSGRLAPARPWLVDGRPDWEAISFEVTCSRCGYNLRGLVEPRCPECGLGFSWQEVINRTANRSTWLFEHQWRKRPVGSWVETVRRSCRPRQFWSDVSIHDRIEVGPLWFLLLSAPVLLALASVAGLFGIYGIARALELMARQAYASPYDAPSMGMWMLVQYIIRGPIVFFVLAPMGFLLAILGLISSLRQTLGRCRVRPVQTLRVLAYAATPICLVPCGLAAGALLLGFMGLVRIPVLNVVLALSFYLTVAVIPVIYLSAGLRHYLQLTHARAVAIVSVLVAYLFVFTVGMILSV